MNPIINASDLTVYGRKGMTRLCNVSMRIDFSDRLCVIGPSGSGKTTLLRQLAGLDHRHKGVIKTVDNLNVGFLFQEGNEVPWLTVRQNFRFYAGTGFCDDRIRHVLATLGFSNKTICGMLNYYPRDLSGGERRRLSLALVVARTPQIVFLDEPMTNLDLVARGRVRAAITNFLQQNLQTAIVLVTHDLEDAILLAKRIYVMNRGSIVKDIKVNPGWRASPLLGKKIIDLENEILQTVDN